MKKFLLAISSAIVIGVVLAIFVFKDSYYTLALTKNKNEIILFQVGVYKEYENAIICSSRYSGSVIINEDDLYRVYIGLAHDKEVQIAYRDHFKLNNINYYERKEYIKDACLEEIKKYESLIKKSFNTETYSNINKNLLNYYKDECHD